MDREKTTASLLFSISGILIFVSLAYFIDLNGFSKYAPILIGLGVFLLFYPEPVLKLLSPLEFMSRPLIQTISHVLIFLGGKVYLEDYISTFWWVYLIIGAILLNKARPIAESLFGKKS